MASAQEMAEEAATNASGSSCDEDPERLGAGHPGWSSFFDVCEDLASYDVNYVDGVYGSKWE